MRRKWRVTANEYGVPFGGNENILKLYSGDGCITINILTVTELINFKWVNCMASEL